MSDPDTFKWIMMGAGAIWSLIPVVTLVLCVLIWRNTRRPK
jgi:hypothetical protein